MNSQLITSFIPGASSTQESILLPERRRTPSGTLKTTSRCTQRQEQKTASRSSRFASPPPSPRPPASKQYLSSVNQSRQIMMWMPLCYGPAGPSRGGHHSHFILTPRDNCYRKNHLAIKQLSVSFTNMVIMMMLFFFLSYSLSLPRLFLSLFLCLLLGRQSQSIAVSAGLSHTSERFSPDKTRESIETFLKEELEEGKKAARLERRRRRKKTEGEKRK